MKLTESRIKEIILEEIEKANKEEKQKDQKKQTDVANMLKLIPNIDNYKEYIELLNAIVGHDFGDPPRKKIILRDLRDKLNKMLTGK